MMMIDLLALDWRERIAEEQQRQSAALLTAVEGNDSRTVEECLRLCDELSEIRRMAVRLADAQWRVGWIANPPMDETETVEVAGGGLGMRIIRHVIDLDSRSEMIKLYPIGDIHIGAAACDEDRLVTMVQRVKADPAARWIGMGDYGDFINVRDKRFNPRTLASWIKPSDFADLAKAQSDRILSILSATSRCFCGLARGSTTTGSN